MNPVDVAILRVLASTGGLSYTRAQAVRHAIWSRGYPAGPDNVRRYHARLDTLIEAGSVRLTDGGLEGDLVSANPKTYALAELLGGEA
jgi:hypothetical protein